MPDDSLQDIVPLSQVVPVRAHPSSVRERRRHGGRGSREKGKKKEKEGALESRDKVTLKGVRDIDQSERPFKDRPNNTGTDSQSNRSPKHVDIRV